MDDGSLDETVRDMRFGSKQLIVLTLQHPVSFPLCVGKLMPSQDLIRKHLMLEGQVSKECLVKILDEATEIYSK